MQAIHNAPVLRQVKVDHPRLKRRVIVCLESRKRRTEDGIEILPTSDFIGELCQGTLF